MKLDEINQILHEYEEALKRDGKTSKSITSRKRDLKKALVLSNSKNEFEKTISNNASFSRFIKTLKETYDVDKIYAIKNAISCYAKLILKKSLFTKSEDIKNALLNYSKAVQKFDEFGEFDTTNIVGEYGEYYVCKKFNLDRSYTNEKYIDATFMENGELKGVQIKARWYHGDDLKSSNIEFGEIKPDKIDYFVGIVFGANFEVLKLIVMSKQTIEAYFHKYVRSKKAIILNNSFDEEQFCLTKLN